MKMDQVMTKHLFRHSENFFSFHTSIDNSSFCKKHLFGSKNISSVIKLAIIKAERPVTSNFYPN